MEGSECLLQLPISQEQPRPGGAEFLQESSRALPFLQMTSSFSAFPQWAKQPFGCRDLGLRPELAREAALEPRLASRPRAQGLRRSFCCSVTGWLITESVILTAMERYY